MISRKELGYVSAWASKAPYPGENYAKETLDELEECLDLFNKEYLNRIYNISFSNNEEIEFQILDKNICHMLGIDYKNLKDDYFTEYRRDILGLQSGSYLSSFDLLSSIVSNKDRVIEYDEFKQANKQINYYKIAVKCAIFRKLADLSAFNYGCINFDRAEYEKSNPGRPFLSNSNRLLYTPSDEIISPYFLMGLVKDRYNDNAFVVETLIAPEEPEALFNNQEVVIPTQIITDNNGVLIKNQATAEEKIKLLKEYQNIISMYNLKNKINIYGDYLSLLMQSNLADKVKNLKK